MREGGRERRREWREVLQEARVTNLKSAFRLCHNITYKHFLQFFCSASSHGEDRAKEKGCERVLFPIFNSADKYAFTAIRHVPYTLNWPLLVTLLMAVNGRAGCSKGLITSVYLFIHWWLIAVNSHTGSQTQMAPKQ